MLFEITVKSTAEARYDDSINHVVRETLTGLGFGIEHEEGGVMFGGVDPAEAAENHYGIEAPDLDTAKQAAAAVANRLDRPVQVYAFGDGVDPMSAPSAMVHPDIQG